MEKLRKNHRLDPVMVGKLGVRGQGPLNLLVFGGSWEMIFLKIPFLQVSLRHHVSLSSRKNIELA